MRRSSKQFIKLQFDMTRQPRFIAPQPTLSPTPESEDVLRNIQDLASQKHFTLCIDNACLDPTVQNQLQLLPSVMETRRLEKIPRGRQFKVYMTARVVTWSIWTMYRLRVQVPASVTQRWNRCDCLQLKIPYSVGHHFRHQV